ncbi:MAG: hypothetical protein L3J32_02515 [Rhizobiaceae bacterium]|nr:hypothetical protein [Rhizobiaceae bacterium]
MENSVIADWEPRYAENFSKENLLLHHRLNETGLFTREALAELIDKCPAQNYNLNTMGYDHENPQWREGIVRGVSGKDVISSIERGRMWLNMRAVESVDIRYKHLLDKLFSEFESNVPGFDSFKTKMGILVSSPLVQVFYHADIPGQSLWQLEGEKRVYVYPAGEPYMSQKSLEGIILGETEEEIPYHSKLDEGATVYELEPGEMVHWPLNCPHRVENMDCLNISVTTEHYTSDIRKSFAVNYANGVLRRVFGMNNLAPSINGPMVYPKAALALVWRKLNLNKSKQVKRMIDFTLDPNADNGIADISAYAK